MKIKNIIKTFNWKFQYFKSLYRQTQQQIWGLEFKVKKSRTIREGVRQDRDRAIEALNRIKPALEAEKDKDVKEKLQQEHDEIQANVTRYEKQMEMIDDQINGAVGTETKEMVIGLLEQIESLTSLKGMYLEELKNL